MEITADNDQLQLYINKMSVLSPEDVALLIGCVTCREVKKGETVLNEGELCRSFYLVKEGYLRTWYNKDGVEINLNFTFEGEFTTNFKSFKGRVPSDLNIAAGEDSSVWIFAFTESLSERFAGNVQIGKFVRRLAFEMLLRSEEHSDLFKIYTPTERYRYIEKNRPKLLQRVPLSQLASYLGVTRETLSRIRAKKL